MAVLKIELCVSLDDSCSFVLVVANAFDTCVALWFHSCVEFEQQYMLDLYTLCCQFWVWKVLGSWRNRRVLN